MIAHIVKKCRCVADHSFQYGVSAVRFIEPLEVIVRGSKAEPCLDIAGIALRGAAEVPLPYAKNIEREAFPREEHVVRAARQLLYRA